MWLYLPVCLGWSWVVPAKFTNSTPFHSQKWPNLDTNYMFTLITGSGILVISWFLNYYEMGKNRRWREEARSFWAAVISHTVHHSENSPATQMLQSPLSIKPYSLNLWHCKMRPKRLLGIETQLKFRGQEDLGSNLALPTNSSATLGDLFSRL